MALSGYSDINSILNELKNSLLKILGENLVGFYLTGSLTYGDFDRGSSDIDFFAVITSKLSDKELSAVEKLHAHIGSMFPEWSKRIEGSYVNLKMLQSKVPSQETRPYVNAGKIWHFPFGDEWLINLFQLKQKGRLIVGKPIDEIVPDVDIEDVSEASKANLRTDWKPKLNEENPFDSKDYDSSHLQAYAIFSMCRALFTYVEGGVVSKKVAALWVKEKYPQWRELVAKALDWKHGEMLDVVHQTKQFIHFVLDEVGIE